MNNKADDNHGREGGKKFDIRQEITDRIIGFMEAGELQFRKTWKCASQRSIPFNAKTGAAYRGINRLVLSLSAFVWGYPSDVWLTYKQAKSMGVQVRKGEKGTLCTYFEKIIKVREADGKEEKEKDSYLLCKPFWLFNAAQVDGLTQEGNSVKAETQGQPPASDAIKKAESILSQSGAIITHGYDMAFYSRLDDGIRLPAIEQFDSPENYYESAFHELTHWTGHPSRLDITGILKKKFGDDAYAIEELVAELGAAYLCGHAGIEPDAKNHAAYLQSWITALKNDKTAIFTASSYADKAADYVLTRAGQQTVSGYPALQAPAVPGLPEADALSE